MMFRQFINEFPIVYEEKIQEWEKVLLESLDLDIIIHNFADKVKALVQSPYSSLKKYKVEFDIPRTKKHAKLGLFERETLYVFANSKKEAEQKAINLKLQQDETQEKKQRLSTYDIEDYFYGNDLFRDRPITSPSKIETWSDFARLIRYSAMMKQSVKGNDILVNKIKSKFDTFDKFLAKSFYKNEIELIKNAFVNTQNDFSLGQKKQILEKFDKAIYYAREQDKKFSYKEKGLTKKDFKNVFKPKVKKVETWNDFVEMVKYNDFDLDAIKILIRKSKTPNFKNLLVKTFTKKELGIIKKNYLAYFENGVLEKDLIKAIREAPNRRIGEDKGRHIVYAYLPEDWDDYLKNIESATTIKEVYVLARKIGIAKKDLDNMIEGHPHFITQREEFKNRLRLWEGIKNAMYDRRSGRKKLWNISPKSKLFQKLETPENPKWMADYGISWEDGIPEDLQQDDYLTNFNKDPDELSQFLFDFYQEGKPKPISRVENYKKALEFLVEDFRKRNEEVPF